MESVIDTDRRSTLPPLDEDLLRQFEAYTASFRPVFHRADQFLRFRAYLRGLLEPLGRKNVESIAAAAGRAMMVEANLAQALQHFVSQSPWDHRRLLAAVRNGSADRRRDPDAVWVVHDAAFAKKGSHSVGVLRQFARSVGRKINCQLGVFVAQVGPRGYFPLAARLYLPSHWLRENGGAASQGVPEEFRRPASKAELALGLLDELRADGEPPRAIAAESGYHTAAEFADGLAKRGIPLAEGKSDTVGAALERCGWVMRELGLDHFEGRTWHGWNHHVSLVFTTYHFLASLSLGGDVPPFSSSGR